MSHFVKCLFDRLDIWGDDGTLFQHYIHIERFIWLILPADMFV